MGEQDLKSDVRQQTGYTDTMILSKDALDTAYRNAMRHLRVTAGVPADSDFDWFASGFPEREDALFWWTCLFAKVAAGELDAQTIQVGAVDTESLLSKADDEVTLWVRNAQKAKQSLASSEGNGIFQQVSVTREGRSYGSDGDSTGSGLGSGNLTGGN